MNPIAYLFSSLKNLSAETELLEACDWDEERLAEVKEIFHNVLSENFNESLFSSWDSLKDHITSKLSDVLSEKESKTCLLILEANMETFVASNKEDGYEN
tara:strand:+ start:3134 stop:3433 length:300 start_codon:yes stop_codon:yes gene_type:complete